MTVECVFGRLKAQCMLTRYRLEVEPENITALITAACRLHNICETRGKVFSDSWSQEVWEAVARQRCGLVGYGTTFDQHANTGQQPVCGIAWPHIFCLL